VNDLKVPAPPSGPVPWAKDFAHGVLLDLLRVRRMEERCAQLYGEQKIRGFLHLYIGEEACATGALRALRPEDNIVAAYREHGHALLRGMPMQTIMAEMYGKAAGCSRGRGGSMHLFDAALRFYGGNAIVGGGLPLAAGLALADKLQKREAITACFFGEGAMAEGAFHEAMNLAALWRLPVLFLCENNRYAMGTALARSESQTELCVKAASYGMATVSVDGMDVVAVFDAVQGAARQVRAGQGPVFVELQTYRFRAHSMFDPELYRDKAEVEAWKTRGPIHTYTARLKAQGLLSEDEFLALDAQAQAEVEDAVAFAEAAPWEPVADLLRDVTLPPGAGGNMDFPPPPLGEGRGGGSVTTGINPHPNPLPEGEGIKEVSLPEGEGLKRLSLPLPPGEGRGEGGTRRITYREAMREALREALQGDERVFLMGEDVGRYGGTYAVSKGLLDEFGPERVRDTPLSELGFTGAGIGAAMGGMRPIVEIMTVNFSLLAMDPIVNTAAMLRHMSGGQFSVPLVIRMATGAGRQVAAQHSNSFEGWFAHVPGLTVLSPATVADARGMLRAALAAPDPVLIFEHVQLYGSEGEASDGVPVDIRHAKVRREGRDVVLITHGGSLPKALRAAEELEALGISTEVLDLRVLRPLDDATILASVRKCRRAVVVDEAWRSGSLAAELMARIMEQAFYELDAPLARVCSEEVPIPYARHLEEAALPQVDKIVATVKNLMGKST
jgi:pyruvate dehydrogenase E1 component beta subunit/2-oxoisovalerate dehydrogenase E1 component